MPVKNEEPAPRKLALFALVYAGSAALQKGIGFAAFLVLAHSLSVEEYARFGLLYALLAGVAGLTGAGVVESVIGQLRQQRAVGATSRLFSAANAVFALQAGACLALIGCIAWGYPHLMESTPASLFVVAAGGLGTAFAVLQSQWARLDERHEVSTAFIFFPSLLGWIAGYLWFLPFGTPQAFFVGLLAGVAVGLLVFRAIGVGVYSFAFEREAVRPILRNLAPFMAVVLVGWISGYGNAFLVEAFFTRVEVARFTFLYTIAAVMQIVATSLNQVWIPRFLKIVDELPHGEVERRSRAFFLRQGAALGLAGAAVLIVLPLMTGIAGEQLSAYHDVNSRLFFLLASYAIAIPWYHAQNYFFAHATGSELLKVTVVSGVIGIAVWIPLMVLLGEIGVYVGFFVFTAIRTLSVALKARSLWQTGLRFEGVLVAIMLQLAGLIASHIIS